MPEVVRATSRRDLDDLRALMSQLAAHFCELGHGPIETDAFHDELEGEGALYLEPAGRMLLARQGEVPVGCAMMRSFEDDICEVRRVFVVPEARRSGVARALMTRMMAEARDAGYTRMRLVTGSGFAPALALYDALGFRVIERYRPTGWEDVTCMEADLT